MKLSQVMHTIAPTQLIIVREYSEQPPKPVLVRGTRKDIPKDSPLNNCTVIEISCNQAHMCIGIVFPNKV